MQPAIYGTEGMVVSGHPLATAAGWSVLTEGGSAADAVIAAAAVLTVALPQAVSIGGDGVALVYDATQGHVHALNATGYAPAASSHETLSRQDLLVGPCSATVPGLVAGWGSLHERFGRLPWRRLLEPSVRAAARGVPTSQAFASTLVEYRAQLEAESSLSALFLPGGAPAPEGAIIQQEALAATLDEIAQKGAGAYYGGRIARALADAVRHRGGLLTEQDLAAFKPEWVEPIATHFRGHMVYAVPPNSYGILLLLQLKALEELGAEYEAAPLGSAERLKHLIGVAKAAFQAGQNHIADPHFAAVPTSELLSRSLVPDATPKMRTDRGGTAVVSAIDRDRNGVTLVQSVFTLFGSFVHDPATGILLNNRMRGFSTDPHGPNALAGGKRPAHTLSPAMVLKDGSLRFLLGTPGGPGQTITLAQVISNRLVHDLPISDAISAPRWSLDLDGNVLVEHGVDRSGLDAVGIDTTLAASTSPFFGSAEVIEVLSNGVFCGAADSRREALVLGA
jgi:gamma-glutamyltranspeptidase